jgi:hypothetical protein
MNYPRIPYLSTRVRSDEVQRLIVYSNVSWVYSGATVFTGNKYQNLPQLRETADNTERYT